MAEAATPPEPAPTNAVDRAIVAISKALSWTFALSIVVTIYDVLCDLFGTPTIWVYDVVTTAIAVAFLVGGSYALQRREHIQITVLYDRYPRRVKLILSMVGSALTIAYLAAFGWFAWTMASLSVASWEVGGSAWRQPTPMIVKVAMFLGVLLMIVQALSNMRADLAALKRRT